MIIQRSLNDIVNCDGKRYNIIYILWMSGKEYIFYTDSTRCVGKTEIIYVSELVEVCKDNYAFNTIEENKYGEIKALFENINDIKQFKESLATNHKNQYKIYNIIDIL